MVIGHAEINITVTYFHDSQERNTFWLFILGLIILPVTSQPPNPEFLPGKKEEGFCAKRSCLFTRSEVHYNCISRRLYYGKEYFSTNRDINRVFFKFHCALTFKLEFTIKFSILRKTS